MQGGAKAPPSSFPGRGRPGLSNLLVTGGEVEDRFLIAREYHESSRLRQGPFVAVRAGQAEFSVALLGRLTRARGAVGDPFHRAEGGTLFVDEIETLELETQRLFLEFLRRGRSEGPDDSGWAGRVAVGASRELGPLVAAGRFLAPLHDALDKIRIDLGPPEGRAGCA